MIINIRDVRRRSHSLTALTLGLFASCASPPAAPSGPVGGTSAGIAAVESFSLPPLPEPRPIGREEYAARRAAFAATLGDGVFVAFGSPEPELDYLPYAQNASFRYLTGVLEPEAALVLVKRGGMVEETLFVQPRNPEREVWEGSRMGTEGATALTGLRALPNDRMLPVLDSLVAGGGQLYVLSPPPATGEEDILNREQQIVAGIAERRPGLRVVPVTESLERLRAQKSPAELDLIRRAVLISALAHREAMRTVAPGMNEFEIHGLVEYVFRRSGAERPAYSSIVGSGPNSTTLHYRSADRFMSEGELLVMDVGASYRGYAADLTRTVPIGGRFTADQRQIYDIVLQAQLAAERAIRVGGSWSDLDGAANRVITEGLTRLGLIDAPDATYDCGTAQAPARCPQFRLFYMHGLGHGVGLEVHDPEISYYGTFQPGSAFTIEPGIYVRSDVLDFLLDTPANRAMIERLRPAVRRYRDIGVRIEDVYLVTSSGVERPATGLPREAADVEALMVQTGLGERDRNPRIVDWYRTTTPR